MTTTATGPETTAGGLPAIIASALVLVGVVLAIAAKVRMRRAGSTSPVRYLLFTPLLAAVSVIAMSGASLFFPDNDRVRWAATVISFASSIGIFILLFMYRNALWAQRK